MATLESINKQALEHIERIETFFQQHVSPELTPLPRTHKNRDLLRLQQLSTIADWLDRVPVQGETAADDTRLADALALIESGSWTKADMESALLGGDDGDPDS